MARRNHYHHMGRVDIYRRKPPQNDGWVILIIGGVIALIILVSCGG